MVHLGVVQLFVVAASATVTVVADHGRTPLHLAAGEGHTTVVQLLVEAAPATITAVDNEGGIPLHCAASEGHTVVVVQLLEAAPATITASDSGGLIPLHCAAGRGHTAVVLLLMAKAPTTVTAVDYNGRTALHWAATYGHIVVVQLLIEEAPATVIAASNQGDIPLHLAAEGGHTGTVQLLWEAAPSTLIAVDNHGRMPLDRALSRGGTALEAARFLVRAAPTVQPTLGSLVRASRWIFHGTHYTDPVSSLYSDLVSRLALTQQEWQSIPARCLDLAHALPAVIERSVAEAGWLVGRLSQIQRGRARTAALCISRVVAGLEGSQPLPAKLRQRILVAAMERPSFQRLFSV